MKLKVSHQIRFIVTTSLLVFLKAISSQPFFAGENALNPRLQYALNTPGEGFEEVFSPDLAAEFEKRHQSFLNRFPDSRWTVNSSKPLRDGRQTVEVHVTGKHQSGEQSFLMEAKQRLAFRMNGQWITSKEIISEQSILRSGKGLVPITLQIPDEVLTGSRYDVDVIFDQPLGDAIVAGGMTSITSKDVENQISPGIELSPVFSGGLFKSVNAPYKPGYQRWAIFLVHPDGLITVSKKVRIVSVSDELSP